MDAPHRYMKRGMHGKANKQPDPGHNDAGIAKSWVVDLGHLRRRLLVHRPRPRIPRRVQVLCIGSKFLVVDSASA